MDVALVDLGVPEDLLEGLEGRAEEVLAQLLETSTDERESISIDVWVTEERVCLTRSQAVRSQRRDAHAREGDALGVR